MSGNEEEENDLDDEEYVPSNPEDSENDEHDENDGTSGDDDASAIKNGATSAIQELKEKKKSEETEDERQRRLKSLFEEFIGGSDVNSKSTACEGLHASTADVKPVSMTVNEIPKLAAETADDIFGAISDKKNVFLKNEPELCKAEEKLAGLVQSEKRKTSNGLTSAISALSKKAKVSVLEKTAQDWGAFKNETGIQEELTSHNRGKKGYVDRVEFLSRTDYRRFEIERNARNAARKKT